MKCRWDKCDKFDMNFGELFKMLKESRHEFSLRTLLCNMIFEINLIDLVHLLIFFQGCVDS